MGSYKYDYQSRRGKKTVNGSTDVITKYCYDGARVIAEYDGSNNLLHKSIYGPGIDKPTCMIDVADSNIWLELPVHIKAAIKGLIQTRNREKE